MIKVKIAQPSNGGIILGWHMEVLATVDWYISMIWHRRYDQPGDCELYVPASHPQAALLVPGNYLIRDDDYMVCRITKVEHELGPNGSNLVVVGEDILNLLGRRIAWHRLVYNDQSIIAVIRGLINHSAKSPTISNREMDLYTDTDIIAGVAQAAGWRMSAEYLGDNILTAITDICRQNGFGIAVQLYAGLIRVLVYAQNSLTNVTFSPRLHNINRLKWVEHDTKEDVILAAGADTTRDIYRAWDIMSYHSSAHENVDRWEQYLNAGDIPLTMTYAELKTLIPAGAPPHYGIAWINNVYCFMVEQGYLRIPVTDDDLLTLLRNEDPTGTLSTESGRRYWTVGVQYPLGVFETTRDNPSYTVTDDDVANIGSLYYYSLLSQRAAAYAAGIKPRNYIEADLDWTAYTYKSDYDVGDIVTIEDGAGHSMQARITEMLESMDATGYKLQPTLVEA